MTVFCTPNKARNTLVLRTPFSARSVTDPRQARNLERERRASYPLADASPTDTSGEPFFVTAIQ
jgi:hypothetical protein